MLRFLFPRLTPKPSRGAELFAVVSAEARRPHWYVEGESADTVDGRFAVLATVAALVIVRLERGGARAQGASVALVERFVEAMDAEHRQMGMGDPAVGRTVRKLVGALSRRSERWRKGVAGEWSGAVRDSLFGGAEASEPALQHCERELRRLWTALERISDEDLIGGRLE